MSLIDIVSVMCLAVVAFCWYSELRRLRRQLRIASRELEIANHVSDFHEYWSAKWRREAFHMAGVEDARLVDQVAPH